MEGVGIGVLEYSEFESHGAEAGGLEGREEVAFEDEEVDTASCLVSFPW